MEKKAINPLVNAGLWVIAGLLLVLVVITMVVDTFIHSFDDLNNL
jgi:hypothetical protein